MSKQLSIVIAILFALPTVVLSAEPQPLMTRPGKLIVSKEFNNKSDVDKKWMKFRKETKYKVEKGILNVIPPRIAYLGMNTKSKWAKSDFSRAGFVGLPKDYICTFRWKCNTPPQSKQTAKAGVYIDLGHRCIRITFSRSGTTLLLENHLVGKGKKETVILQQAPQLKLKDEKWYDIIVEVKGNEVVVQIDGQTLYGKNDLILKDRANTFNLDSKGAGYLLDNIEFHEAGAYQPDWKAKRKQLGTFDE